VENLTATAGWPQVTVAAGDAVYARPAILEIV
jgi:hypothetical protein